jgi:hypothetical protein
MPRPVDGYRLSLSASRIAPQSGEPLTAATFDEYRHEIPNRTLGEAVVLAVDGLLDLLRREFRKLPGEAIAHLPDRVSLCVRSPIGAAPMSQRKPTSSTRICDCIGKYLAAM